MRNFKITIREIAILTLFTTIFLFLACSPIEKNDYWKEDGNSN